MSSVNVIYFLIHTEKLSEASTDFDAWLDTASEQADRIFKFPSLQNRNIDGIKK